MPDLFPRRILPRRSTCLFWLAVLPLFTLTRTAPAQRMTLPVDSPTSVFSVEAPVDEQPEEATMTQRPTAPDEKNHHVIVYHHRGQPLPNLQDFQADLPFLQRFLKLQSLRFYLTPAQLNTQNVKSLLSAVETAGFHVEVVLYDTQNLPDSQTALRWLDTQKNVKLIALPYTTAHFGTLYTTLRAQQEERVRPFKQAVTFDSIKEVLRFKREKQSSPDVYLYHFKGDISDFHPRILRLNEHFDKPWQLAQLSVPVQQTLHTREYERTWLYRFAFYFSKKYGLVPAPAFYRGHERHRMVTPGLLRADRSFLPTYWLTHIYYHLNRIDLDEAKLTRALYTEITHGPQNFDSDADFLRRFLNTYYKVNPEDHILNYAKHKRTGLFYDFLKIQTEESLLNSHFARLKAIRLREPTPRELILKTPTIQQATQQVKLSFLSALGRYNFLQTLYYQKTGDHYWVERTTYPTLASDFKVYTHAPELLPKLSKAYPATLKTQLKAFRPLSSATQLHLLFDIRNTSTERVDLQPLALTSQQTQRVYIPEPLFFEFFKQLAPGQRVKGVLPFPATEAPFNFQIQPQPASDKHPRLLATRLSLKGRELQIHIKNPFVERLLLPGLSLFIEQQQRLFTLEYVIPQALLPLEERTYRLTLPKTFQPELPFSSYSSATAFPIVDREINLDDAFRSDVMGFKEQALEKYRRAYERFGNELKPYRRWNILRRIVFLSVLLESPARTEATFNKLLKQTPFTGERLARLHLDLAEAYLGHSSQKERGNLALEHIKRAFALKNWTPRVQDHMLYGYVLKTNGALKPAEVQYLKALSLSLPQRKSPTQDIYKILVDLTEAQSAYSNARNYLLQWRQSKGYKDNPQHLKRLGYFSLKQQHYPEALNYYLDYARSSGDVSIYPDIAALYRRQQQPAQAITWYEKYLRTCQRCTPGVYKELGYLLEKRNPGRALDLYVRYLAQNNDAPLRDTVISLAIRQQRYALANRQLQQALNTCRRDCDTLSEQQGFVYQKQGNLSAALEAYTRSLRRPTLARWQAVAYLAQSTGRYDLSIRAFEQLLKSENRTAWRLALAELYTLTQQPRKALNTLNVLTTQPRTLSPEDQQTLLNLYLGAATDPQALNLFERIKAGPVVLNAESYYLAGRLYFEQGQLAQAALALEQAIARSTEPVAIHYRLLASIYEKQGDPQQAIDTLETLKSYF